MDPAAKLENKRVQQAAANLERLVRLEKRNKIGHFTLPTQT
jgi:hypothetical protein